MHDWDQYPEKYQRDSDGNFIFKKDGTPRKRSGRAKGSTGTGYNYHSATKAKIESKRANLPKPNETPSEFRTRIASRYQGGMVDRDPYKRQPRFI